MSGDIEDLPAVAEHNIPDASTPKQRTDGDVNAIDSKSILAQRAESGLGLSLYPEQNGIPGNHSEEEIAAPLELQPLLPRSLDLELADAEPRRQEQVGCSYVRWAIFTLCVAMILFFLTSAGLLVKKIEPLLSAAITPAIDAISIFNVTDSGIAAHVVGSVTVDYKNITNPFYRYALQVSGAVIGPVLISSRDVIQVSIAGPDFAKARVIDILLPEMMVDLVNKRVSPVDFIAEPHFVEPGVQTVVNSLLAHHNTQILLEVELLLSPTFRNRWIFYKGRALQLVQTVVVLPENTNIPMQTTDAKAEFGINYISIVISATIDPLPMEFSLKPIEWDVLLRDCNGDPTLLGVWASEGLAFKPRIPTYVGLSGSVLEIRAELLEQCPDGISPFNKFIQHMFDEEVIDIRVSATKSDNNKANLTPWLYNVLTLMQVEFKAPIPENLDQAPNFLPHGRSDVTLNLLNIEFLAGSESDIAFNMGFDGSVNVALPVENKGFEVLASHVISDMTIFTEKEPIALVLIRNGSLALSSNSSTSTNSVDCKFTDLTVRVTKPDPIGSAISSILSDTELPVFQYLSHIHEACLKSRLFTTKLSNLTIGSANLPIPYAEFHKDSKKTNSSESFFNWLLHHANMLLGRIAYDSSSADELAVLVECDINNPVKMSFASSDAISFEYFINSSQVGTISMNSLTVEITDLRQAVWVKIVLKKSPVDGVGPFLSALISGDPVKFDMKGTQSKQGLGKLLQHVHLQNIILPPLQFNRGNDDTGIACEVDSPKHSPFLISATIHIWTSDIELTVWNPLQNAEIAVQILDCDALYEEKLLAHIESSEVIIIPPGVQKTPRIPIQISKGLVAKILRKAINGQLPVKVLAELQVFVGQFSTKVNYHGSGLTATIRL